MKEVSSTMFADRLTNIRKKKNITQQRVADYLGVTRPAYTAYERGTRQPDYETLKKLADFFDVSIDYLLTGKETKKSDWDSKLPELTEKDERDIAKKLERILGELESGTGLAFDGEPMDETTRELVKAQIESNLRIAKQMAKKKFTPKKYRKDGEE
jgi:transcriptional regulator with XRE-family HTH domain